MKNRKQKEFLELYEPIHERFERFCRARVYGKMDFRDLINETLMVAYENLHTLRSKDAFLSYLFSVSVRVLSNHHRKDREVLQNDLNGVAPIHVNFQSDPDVHFLHKALAKLNDQQKESIILFEISGFSIKEIAVIQESTESAVKQRLKRGRDRLKQLLTEDTVLKTGRA